MAEIFQRGKPLVTIKGVTKSYGKSLILRDIGTDEMPFVISDIARPNKQQGQTVAVVGPSGSGKSTLFKLISGIYEPTTGLIEIPDGEIFRPVSKGDIGYVQQTYPLSRNDTVYAMLMDAAIQGKMPKNERHDIITKYLEDWGLIDQRKLAKKSLSGGQRQRVAIIEQLLCSHNFFIFDEPFSGLDVKNIKDVKDSFAMIGSSAEINTIIFSTHDIRLAVELSDVTFVIGKQKDQNGVEIPGGTIIQRFDQKDSGLAWQPYGAAHEELRKEIENLIENS
jgi:polar amino acid transport system ATP-binding protein